MLYFKRAFFSWAALGQFCLGLLRHIVTVYLTLMARLAEMRGAPAEPLGKRTAEPAFELDIVSSVLLAICYACSYTDCRAFTAYQLLQFIWLTFLLGLDTILHSSKVGVLALEALIISQLIHCVLLNVLEVDVVRVWNPGVFLKSLELRSLHCFLNDFIFYFLRLQ